MSREDGLENSPSEAGTLPGLLGRYVQTLCGGWWSVAAAGWQSLRGVLGGLSFMQVAFLLGCLGMIAMTLLFPWIVYDVNLLAPEVAGRGSNYRLLFFLPGPLGVLLSVVGGRFRLPLYYAGTGIAALLYLAGILWPNPVHTLMRDPAEYRFHFSMYIYGACLALTIATAWQALRTHLVSIAEIRAYLLETRSPAEDLNAPATLTVQGKRN